MNSQHFSFNNYEFILSNIKLKGYSILLGENPAREGDLIQISNKVNKELYNEIRIPCSRLLGDTLQMYFYTLICQKNTFFYFFLAARTDEFENNFGYLPKEVIKFLSI